MNFLNFNNAVVPVTGAASGIGLAICRLLRAHGARPILMDVNTEQLKSSVEDLYPGEEWSRFGYPLDVRASSAVDAAFDAVRRDHGPITHAVANAGIVWRGNVMDMPEDVWKALLDINLNGVLHTCRAAARHMTADGGGAIVTMSSIGGILAKEQRAAYGASKAAIVQLTRAFALDLASKGIRVNCVAPGLVKTPIQQATEAAAGADAIQALAARSALKRLGEPEEIAQVVLFLLSDLASYMTGETVVVDGGLGIHYG
jgi:NAD(P)-dependent dehydrogenase (short-subunit alcohol dehydrogenase family)